MVFRIMSADNGHDDETENVASLLIDSGQSNQRSNENNGTGQSNNVNWVHPMRREDYPRRDDKFYDRLATYENFPESCPVSAENLAKAGFRYTGVNDMVLCDYCQGRLQRWEETDDPIVEHARHYQNCEFLLPLTQAPHNPEYLSVEARASSFDNETWHNRENEDTPPSEELANAGFYFVGGLEQGREVSPDQDQVRPTYRSDATKCFHCNTTLHSWDHNDNVWVEHARWSPRCGFLISQCGLDFVRQHSGSGDDDENLSNLASSRLALEAHAEAGYGHSRRPRQRDSQRYGQEETAHIVSANLGRNVEPIAMPETTEEYQKEFDLLIKQVQCKVCLSNRSSILFLPCRHISVCPECARQLPEDICPLCRAPIEHMIDAFIS